MRYVFLLALLLLSVYAQAQRGAIRGRVIDFKTLQPIPYSNVYFNNTSIGTSTDNNGEFTLSAPPGTHELVVSFVGYKTHQATVRVTDNTILPLLIKLSAMVLAEVQVTAKRDKAWAQQLEKFKRHFFGDSPNTALCRITNPWVLDFNEDNNGMFTAWATGPIHIENMALGYKLFYQLSQFSADAVHYSILGTVRFSPIASVDTAVISLWQRNRNIAYQGSTRHLFKSIIDNNVQEQRFELYEDLVSGSEIIRTSTFLANVDKNIASLNPVVKLKDISSREYVISLPPRTEVIYLEKSSPAKVYRTMPHPISWLEVKNKSIIVSEQGNLVSQNSLLVLGALSNSRVAEMLPYDYEPTLNTTPRPIAKKKISSFASLIEKPYLHTTKSYYYPHEIIWFKAYMNYYAPAMKDSLSRVLYIDLVNSAQQIISTKIFPMADGWAQGSITLPQQLPKGDYQLRAYTRWMLNFNSSLVYSKAIKILDDDEAAQLTSLPHPSASAGLSLITDKEIYSPNEKITLTLAMKDFYGASESTNLSISVTDIEQAVPVRNESSIVNDFDIKEELLPDSTVKIIQLIQNGIDIKGYFVNKRNKKVQGRLTFVQPDLRDAFTTTTEVNGDFYIPDLSMFDSARLSVEATSFKGKKSGKIILDSAILSPPITNITALSLNLEKPENTFRSHQYDDEQLPARVLEEITIQDSKINSTPSGSLHLSSDAVVTGDWLVQSNSFDVLQSLQSKVPGMRIIVRIINEIPRKFLSFGINSFGSSGSMEPLLLIDGLAITQMDAGDMTVAERISAMTPYEVERIEVIKFGGGASYGARGGNGVIAITTRKTAKIPRSSTYDSKKLVPLSVVGFSSWQKFSSPDYSEINNKKKPDYRSVVYWNPMIFTDIKTPSTAISFYAADLPTQYRIVVEGITASGKPVRGEKLITIQKQP